VPVLIRKYAATLKASATKCCQVSHAIAAGVTLHGSAALINDARARVCLAAKSMQLQ
jgi:hypothetical protein